MSAQPSVLPDERHHRVTVPVRGGELTVGVWEPETTTGVRPEGPPTVLAVHGVTSSHLAWPAVAASLPDVRVIAPEELAQTAAYVNEVPPLYPAAAREHWRAEHPQIKVGEIEDVNHHTVVMTPAGATQLKPWIRRALTAG